MGNDLWHRRCRLRLNAERLVCLAAMLLPINSAAEMLVQGTLAGDRMTAKSKSAVDKVLKSYACYSLTSSVTIASLQKRSAGPSDVRLKLSADRDWVLLLEPIDPRTANYRLRLITRDGSRDSEPAPASAFRGSVKGADGGDAYLSIRENGIWGYVMQHNRATWIQPVSDFDPSAGPSLIVLYDPADMVVRETEEPQTNDPRLDEDLDANIVSAMPRDLGKSLAEPCKSVNVAIGVSNDLYTRYMSVQTIEQKIVDHFNLINEFYADPAVNIYHRISEIVIDQTDAEPWGAFDYRTFSSVCLTWAKGPNGFKNPFGFVAILWGHGGEGGYTGFGYKGPCTMGSMMRNDLGTGMPNIFNTAHEIAHVWGAKDGVSGTPPQGKRCLLQQGQMFFTGNKLSDAEDWCGELPAILATKHAAACMTDCGATESIDVPLTKGEASFPSRLMRVAVIRDAGAYRIRVHGIEELSEISVYGLSGKLLGYRRGEGVREILVNSAKSAAGPVVVTCSTPKERHNFKTFLQP